MELVFDYVVSDSIINDYIQNIERNYLSKRANEETYYTDMVNFLTKIFPV